MRAKSLCQIGLEKSPDNPNLQRAIDELEQLSYLVEIKLDSLKTTGRNLV